MKDVSNLDLELLSPSLGPARADDRRPSATADCPGTNRHRESTVNTGEGIRSSSQDARAAALRAPLRVKRRAGQTDVLRALENRHRWLLFAQHCYTCMRPEEACKLGKLCTYGKKTLKHVAQCKKDECSYPRCSLLRPLLQHSRKCQSSTCAICVPVWNYIQKESLQQQQEQQQVLQVLQQVPGQQQQQQYHQREAVPQRPAASSAATPAARHSDARAITPTPTGALLGQTGHHCRPTITPVIAPTTSATPAISPPEPSAIGTAQLDKDEGAGSTCGAIGIGRAEANGTDLVPLGSAGAAGSGGGRLSVSGTDGAAAGGCAGDGSGSGGAGRDLGGDTCVGKLAGSEEPEMKPTFPTQYPPTASNPQLQPTPQPQRQLQALHQPQPHQTPKPTQQETPQQEPTIASTAHRRAAATAASAEAYLPHLRLPHGGSQAAPADALAVSTQGVAKGATTVPAAPAESLPAASRTAPLLVAPPQGTVSSHPQPPTFHFVHSYPPSTSIGAYFPHLAAGPHPTAHGGPMASPIAPTWWHFPGVAALPSAAVNGLHMPAAQSASGSTALHGVNGASSIGIPSGAAGAMWPHATHVRPNAVQYGTGHDGTRQSDASGGLAQPLGMPPPADRYGHAAYRIPGVSAAAVSLPASVPLSSTPVPTPMVLWTPGPPPQALPAAVGSLPPHLTAHPVTAPYPLSTPAAASAAAGPCPGAVGLAAAHPRAMMPPVHLAPHALLYGHGALMPAAAAPGSIACAPAGLSVAPGVSSEGGTGVWSHLSH